MADVSRELLAPLHFQRIGWQGLSLIVPEGWNLRLFDGDERKGALFFADLHATRLEVRWRSQTLLARWCGGDVKRLLEKSVARLRGRHSEMEVRRLSAGAVRIEHPQAVFVLAAAGGRLCELHWPKGASGLENEFVNTITEDFLERIAGMEGKAQRLWSIYGAQGWVPATARLKKASLLPGAATLSFSEGAGLITLGAVSLADRILREAGSLRRWAAWAIPLVAKHPGGRWEESEATATFTADGRRRFRRVRHRLALRHDLASNRICWTHHLGPPLG